MHDKSISVVIPVFNENENVAPLYQELSGVLSKTASVYEIIFIDDGSIDGTVAALKNICAKDKNVKVIALKRNYGQTAAIMAGIDASKYDYILTMDGDMQNDPAEIPRLLDKIDEGYDLVSGWRKSRKDPFLSKRLPSLIANKVISAMTGVRLHDYGCTLKVYRKDFLKNVNLYGEMHRFIPVYIYFMGGKITEIPVNHRKREKGRSKYGIGRTTKVILDLLTVRFLLGNYSTSPLYFFGGLGFFLMSSGVLCAFITLLQKFFIGALVHRNPLILLAIFLFIVGTQFIFMGLLAELNMRIYYESTKKSIYAVGDRINCEV
jgi:glycosyltransferase involved in cell wall biosynthesis